MNNEIILSIVIPTKNRANLLRNVLESIQKQKVDAHIFETLIIDNGSTDNTRAVVREYQKKNKNYRYIYDARPGLHVGRNRGLRESKGELVGYLDDDVILFPNCIHTVLEAFKDKEIMYVNGSVIPYDKSLLTSDFRAKYEIRKGTYKFIYPISCFWEVGITEKDTRIHRAIKGSLFGGNSIYRKSVLYACHGFHPDGMPGNLLMYRGDGESHVEQFIFEHKMKAMYYAQASVYHMIDMNRISDSYINYMHFRSGISSMYTCLRANGGKGGIKYFWNAVIRNEKNIGELKGEAYLLLYYVFYGRVRKWIHKKDYF